MKKNLIPTAGRVLIKIKEADNKTESGIYLNAPQETRIQHGTVIALGEQKVSDGGIVSPRYISVGNEVIFDKYHGIEVDEGLVLVLEDQIMAIIDVE